MMATPLLPPPLKPRMTTTEVCEVMRCGKGTLRRRRYAGEFPAPVGRGKELLYDGFKVGEACGLIRAGQETDDPWGSAADAYCTNQEA